MQDWQSKIDTIMDNFDFAAVAKTMAALDWEWAVANGEMKVPDEAEIRSWARARLWAVVEHKSDAVTIGSGGFTAKKNDGELSLQFIVSSWDTDPES